MQSVSLKRWSILNMLAFVVMIVVNTLAVVLPINGMDTGSISDRYPNLFVPAGLITLALSFTYAATRPTKAISAKH